MKDYRKFIKKVLKNKDFKLVKSGRTRTVKLTYVPTGEMYSIHESDKAINPIKSWLKRLKRKDNMKKLLFILVLSIGLVTFGQQRTELIPLTVNEFHLTSGTTLSLNNVQTLDSNNLLLVRERNLNVQNQLLNTNNSSNWEITPVVYPITYPLMPVQNTLQININQVNINQTIEIKPSPKLNWTFKNQKL